MPYMNNSLARVAAKSPVLGMYIVDTDDLFPQGFTDIHAAYASLGQTFHDYDMLMESAPFDEVDDYYNPGVEDVPSDYIFEAIVVNKFSGTEKRMTAVVRVLNRHLKGSSIMALPPIVGKPRKAGGFAYVTVQLPFDDGQSVSVIFHSPEGDKRKISSSDTIIAFQWLLNRRDITHVVAPEDGTEVSLETIAKRVTQLVEKNSARFQSTQKDAVAERKELDDAKQAVIDAEERQVELMDRIVVLNNDVSTVDAKLANTIALLEKQKGINAELQAKLDGLQKSVARGKEAKAGKQEKQKVTPEKQEDVGADKPDFVKTLDDIIAGVYGDATGTVGTMLDKAAEEAEKTGVFEQYEALFNQAADHLTTLLKKRAANANL